MDAKNILGKTIKISITKNEIIKIERLKMVQNEKDFIISFDTYYEQNKTYKLSEDSIKKLFNGEQIPYSFAGKDCKLQLVQRTEYKNYLDILNYPIKKINEPTIIQFEVDNVELSNICGSYMWTATIYEKNADRRADNYKRDIYYNGSIQLSIHHFNKLIENNSVEIPEEKYNYKIEII